MTGKFQKFIYCDKKSLSHCSLFKREPEKNRKVGTF